MYNDTKKTVTARGRAMLAQMQKDKMYGNGWKIQVWENMGWHCSIVKGSAVVYELISNKQYLCLINDEPNKPGVGAFAFGTDVCRATPQAAFRAAYFMFLKYKSKLDEVSLELCGD